MSRVPPETTSTEALLRLLMRKQRRKTKTYTPLTKQEIVEWAGTFASEFGATIDEALWEFVRKRGITDGTRVNFLREPKR